MKKLTKFLITGTAIIWLALGIKECFGVPKGFENYKSWNSYVEQSTENNKQFIIIGYDKDGDLKTDCQEFYGLTPFGPTQNPIIYWFDTLPDHKAQKNEIYLDENMDGLNGNEIQQKYKLEYMI